MIIIPKMLKNRWLKAATTAVTLSVKDANNAVTVVPMFAPNVNGYICRRVRTPAPARGIIVEVVIDEIKKFLKFTEKYPTNQDKEPWSIAVLTFHQAQATILRDGIRKLSNQPNKISKFNIKDIEILLYTVDKFQGMEADIVFISMMKTQSIGFLDNINRLNVALTRAKYQRVIVGDKSFFEKQRGSDELKILAKNGGM